jgi:PAS domain S-box-containing protein
MQFSLTLKARSVILTGLLLAVQIGFILALSQVLRISQDSIEKQWRSENIIRLVLMLNRSYSSLIAYSHTPVEFRDYLGVDPYVELSRANNAIKILGQLVDDDPQKQVPVRRIIATGKEMIGMLNHGLDNQAQAKGQPLNFAMPVSFRALINKLGADFFNSIEELMDLERRSRAGDDAIQASFSTVTATLVIAVLVSIGMAVFLGFAYALSIRRPLRHLSENARLLSSQKPLLPQLSQVDEFGRLDTILHATAREIERTLEQERDTIANAADLICALDADGNFLSVNSFAQRMLGIEPEAFIGMNLHDLAVAEESLLADEQVRAAVNSPAVSQFELKLRTLPTITSAGGIIVTLWSCLWSDAERKLFCVVRDITEEKRIEQLKQDFADMISHDLRSPLMAMGNSLTLLKAGVTGELPEEARRRIETSSRNVEKLIVLVNDLLDFQKLKAGKMDLVLEPVALQSVVRDAAGLVEEAALDKKVVLDLPDGETLIRCDRNKLMQTAVNLISNAIKFSGDGGRVTVKVEAGNDGKAGKSGKVLFSVADTGPGVAQEFQQRIFEPFEQAPSGKKSEGTGLGLAICKLVVEAHGGFIKVDNLTDEQGKIVGSIFTVELPVSPGERDKNEHEAVA